MEQPDKQTTAAGSVAGFAMSSALIVVTAVLLVGFAVAQEPERLMIDVGACVVLETDEERFACYEERVNLGLRQRWSMDTGERESGERTSALPAAAAVVAEQQGGDTDSGDIYGTILALRETVPDRVVVTLDNGQIWRQTSTANYPLQVGHQVRIYRGRIGGDRLAVEELGGFIRVERVR